MIKRNFTYYFIFILSVVLAGCIRDKTGGTKDSKYSIYILAKDGKEYLLGQHTLDAGSVKPEEEGVLLDSKDMDRDVFVKNGFFYHLNRKKALFSKFMIAGGQLKTAGALKLTDFSIENLNWVGKDTLLLTGLNISGFNRVKYVLIKVNDMEIIAKGNMEIGNPSGKFTTTSVGLVEKRKNKLFVGYTYHAPHGISNYETSDTLYISELNFPAMKLVKIEKDTRSTYPGGENTIQSYTFRDDKQDYYFMSCPGIALGNRPEIPTGIFRLKANTDVIDKDYFFNISAAIHNHAYGMWYLGGSKAIIRAERKDLYTDLSDHFSKAHFEFYVLDLDKKTTNKLELPLDKGTRRECVIVEGDTAYIAVNSTKEGNYIWLYNIKTGTLRKGLQLAGDTDFIMRIDKLKD